MNNRAIWSILRKTLAAWNAHEATRLGASLAFYSVLSLAPLVILTIATVGLVIGRSAAQQQVVSELQALLGTTGSQSIGAMIVGAQDLKAGSIASVLGLATLLFSASQVFAELQAALNKIWDVKAEQSSGVLLMVRQRLLSFGLVLSIGLLLLISLILSAALAAAGKFMGGLLPLPEWSLHVINLLVSIVGISALFALIFKYIPDADTDWRHVWIGAVVTASLFSLGKLLIGLYLGKAGVGSTYGAAGSLVVVIMWVYYSSQIVFFGAELTHVLHEQQPRAHGVRQVRVSAGAR
jgi:membrane protein